LREARAGGVYGGGDLSHCLFVEHILQISHSGKVTIFPDLCQNRKKQSKEGFMKTTIFIWLSVITFAFSVVAVAKDQRHDRRQNRQNQRIQKGVENGSLTAKEQKTVERRQERIQKIEVRFASDGEIDAKEKIRLEHQQNKASRQIRRLKHNDRKNASQ
jgi:hypothetical protein